MKDKKESRTWIWILVVVVLVVLAIVIYFALTGDGGAAEVGGSNIPNPPPLPDASGNVLPPPPLPE